MKRKNILQMRMDLVPDESTNVKMLNKTPILKKNYQEVSSIPTTDKKRKLFEAKASDELFTPTYSIPSSSEMIKQWPKALQKIYHKSIEQENIYNLKNENSDPEFLCTEKSQSEEESNQISSSLVHKRDVSTVSLNKTTPSQKRLNKPPPKMKKSNSSLVQDIPCSASVNFNSQILQTESPPDFCENKASQKLLNGDQGSPVTSEVRITRNTSPRKDAKLSPQPALDTFNNRPIINHTDRRISRRSTSKQLYDSRKLILEKEDYGASILFTRINKEKQALYCRIIREFKSLKYNTDFPDGFCVLVTSLPYRKTMSFVLGILNPRCHIISENWIKDSQKAGFWLSFDQYYIENIPENGSIKRQNIGQLFKDVDSIYVPNKKMWPERTELWNVIKLFGGKIASYQKAKIVINAHKASADCVTPLWLLDSIVAGEVLPLSNFPYKK